MEMTERMGDGVREIMNVQMSVCRRVKEGWKERKKKRRDARRSLDSSDALFGAASFGNELLSDYSRIRMAALDLERKKNTIHTERRHRKHAGEAVLCRNTSP